MKTRYLLIQAFFILALCSPSFVFAAGGHNHGTDGSHAPLSSLSATKLQSIAKTQLAKVVDNNTLVEGKILDKGWKQVEQQPMKISTLRYGFKSVQVTHPSNEQTLFMLFSSKGDLKTINHSGRFKGLN